MQHCGRIVQGMVDITIKMITRSKVLNMGDNLLQFTSLGYI